MTINGSDLTAVIARLFRAIAVGIKNHWIELVHR